MDEHRGITKGVLMQTLGPRKGLVAYLSKKLDLVETGWPPCLRIIVAVVMLVKDADKLTLGQNITTAMPHALEEVLKQPSNQWLSNVQMTHYQTLLLNPVKIMFQVPIVLNLTMLLPDPDLKALCYMTALGFWHKHTASDWT